MTTPNLIVTPGGANRKRYRLLKRPRGNHALSGTVTTMGSEPDEDPALGWDDWFTERRAKRLKDEEVYQRVENRLEWIFDRPLREARARVNRTKRPERKAEAQRELDAIQCEHDAALEALPERSLGWRGDGMKARGVYASRPRDSECFEHGPDAEAIEIHTSDGFTLVRAIVAGDPKLASRVYHALNEILDVVDPEAEERPSRGGLAVVE